jgi:hypothetical protein
MSAAGLSATPTPEFRCDYSQGMFSNRFARRPAHPRRHHVRGRALKHHEAGHAVLGYALGFGMTSIRLISDIAHDGKSRRLSGESNGSVNSRDKINRLIRKGTLDQRIVNRAIWTAAGPAAERKHSLLAGITPRQIAGSQGDHKVIETLRKELCYRIEPYFDIEEESWRRAQDALEIDAIWTAVQALANWLDMPEAFDDEPGEHVKVYPGATVRAFFRDHGVRPGMLDDFWPPFASRLGDGPCDRRRGALMNAVPDRRAVLGSILTGGACLSVPSWAGASALVADPVLPAIERHRRAYAAFMEVWGPDERVRSL